MFFILKIQKLTKLEKKFIEHLYQSQIKHVWFLAVRLLKNKEQAEDCTQMVFMKLMGKASLLMGFENERRISGYVSVVTKNTALQVLKKSKVLSEVEFESWENRLFSDMDGIERNLLEQEQWKNLKDIITNLTPIQRQAIYLRYSLELDYPEIADIMNTNINNARARVHSATVNIRESIQKRGIEYE